MRSIAESVVIFRDRFYIKALPFGFRADQASALNRLTRPFGVFGRRRAAEGVADQNRSDAPRRDGASRVALQHLAKGFLALLEPERVQHRHRAIQLWLHFPIAGGRKGNLAELFRRFLLCLC